MMFIWYTVKKTKQNKTLKTKTKKTWIQKLRDNTTAVKLNQDAGCDDMSEKHMINKVYFICVMFV